MLTQEKRAGQGGSLDIDEVKSVTRVLLEYCRTREWMGDDPYDALNSRVYQNLPFLHFKAARLVLTQVLKRSPINFRTLLLVPPSPNPKGLALFVTALLKLSKLNLVPTGLLIEELFGKLKDLRSKGHEQWCWGYPFDWQSRTVLLPRWFPNVICTTFVGNALLDIYDECRKQECLDMAASAAEFLLKTLYFEEAPSVACFSYNTLERSKVHNANLLGAAFVCRVAHRTSRREWLAPALKAARFTVDRQSPDGSWKYGERGFQGWNDNFHTGFNLCALQNITRYSESAEFEGATKRGYDFFRQSFFSLDGAPKYFHDREYPFDIHSAAQSIITLVKFREESGDSSMEQAEAVYRWTMGNLRSEHGWYFFQKHPLYTNRISYMRWSQAWMLLALSVLLEALAPNPELSGEAAT